MASSASGVAVSAAARHDVQGRADAVRQVYRDASRITVASLALALPFLAALADPLTRAWLGATDAQAAVAPLLPWMVLGLHAHMLTGPANAISRGRGRLGADFSYHGLRAAALAVAVAGAWHAGRHDLPALVGAMAMAQVAAALGFLVVAHWRLCGEGRTLARGLGLPTLAAYALAWALALGVQAVLPLPANAHRLQALGALLAATAVWLPLAALLLGRLLLSPGEIRSLVLRLPRPLSWRTA
jgi:O-antigen/teichoic acid export membrane protein